MTIRHVVSWKLASEDAAERAEQVAEITRLLDGLVGVVPEILALRVGTNIAYPESNADAVIIADFESIEALERYQVHPAHQEVVTYIRSVVATRMVVDFEV